MRAMQQIAAGGAQDPKNSSEGQICMPPDANNRGMLRLLSLKQFAIAVDMAVELGACGAYLVVGQLLRRSGLINDGDTQAWAPAGVRCCM